MSSNSWWQPCFPPLASTLALAFSFSSLSFPCWVSSFELVAAKDLFAKYFLSVLSAFLYFEPYVSNFGLNSDFLMQMVLCGGFDHILQLSRMFKKQKTNQLHDQNCHTEISICIIYLCHRFLRRSL